jgi:UDP-N-acetylmuramoyl-L-alanyl-D-glutamate--2,6-diaminopimelate ligase
MGDGRRGFPAPPAWAHELVSIGVTGTDGKTTTTTLAAAALRALGTPVIRVTTIGIYLDDERLDVSDDYDGFLQAMRIAYDAGARAAAVELTSEALAAGFARAWPWRVGVLTSFSRDHLDSHGTTEHYLASKAQLFMALPCCGTAVLPADEPCSDLIAELVPPCARIRRFSSRGGDADVTLSKLDIRLDGTRFELAGRIASTPRKVWIPAIGAPFAEDALAALAAVCALGVHPARAIAQMALAAPPPGRFELVAKNPLVVVDFAHTPHALTRTIATARALCSGRLTLVFGAGGDRDRGKRALMGAAACAADAVILTSDNPRSEDPRRIVDQIRSGMRAHPDLEIEIDRERAIQRAIARSDPGDMVLITGRGHEREQIVGDQLRPLSDVDAARAACC